jgi:hypothetical protein
VQKSARFGQNKTKKALETLAIIASMEVRTYKGGEHGGTTFGAPSNQHFENYKNSKPAIGLQEMVKRWYRDIHANFLATLRNSIGRKEG